MIRSMSGHGRGEADLGEQRVTAEVRTVNHRFCPISLRLPADLHSLEEAVRRRVQGAVQRGKVDLSVSVDGRAGGAALDRELAARWARELKRLAVDLELAEPRLEDLLQLPGVLVESASGLEGDRAEEVVFEAVDRALAALDEFRRREGRDLSADLSERVAAMRDRLERIETVADELPARARDSLRTRIAELLEEAGGDVDESRIVQEAAYQADKADITEELVRLRSHLDKLEGLLESSGEPVGRTLEFLAQEIHREINTIGAKTKDLSVADTTVELKADLERVREQVQNVE